MGAELVALFEESVLEVRHLERGERFTVGEGVGADLPCAELGALCELMRVGVSGIELVHRDGVDVELLDRDMALTWTRELPHDALVAVLPEGTRARLTFGALTLLVSPGTAPERAALGPSLELRDHLATVGVGVLAILCMIILNAIPPGSPSLSLDENLLALRGARFLVTAPQPPKMPDTIAFAPPTATSSGGARSPSRGPRASAPVKNPGPPKKAGSAAGVRELAEAAASNAGILGLIQQSTQAGSLFGGTSVLGAGGSAVFGEITDQSGCGGCGGSSTSGSVGWSTGPGGRADTIAGGPIGSRTGHRGSGPTLTLERKTHPIVELRPDVRLNEGPYDKETIRRVIRARMNEFLFCYEKELQRDPSLTGRVVPKFTIEPNGRVVAAVLESSTLGNPVVESCVVAATRRLEFSRATTTVSDGAGATPPRGLTIVSYPFVFKTAAQN